VKIGAFPNGSNFAATEKASQGKVVEFTRDHSGIMIGNTKHPHTASITGAKQSGDGLLSGQILPGLDEKATEIKVGTGGVAHLELDRLPDTG
jgi:hypothetical protein